MKNVVEKADETNYVFTEGIDYLTTGKDSIWGSGDRDTLEELKKIKFRGRWLNLAAGDGRYNNGLLEQADEVMATDIDQSALAKLEIITPDNLKNKLKTQRINLLDRFPFGDGCFNGVFCVGTLHLFPIDRIEEVFKEITRVLDESGEIFIDFATDISRLLPDGSQREKTNETSYTTKEAESLFRENFRDFNIVITRHKVPEETVTIGELLYVFSCNYIIVRGRKK